MYRAVPADLLGTFQYRLNRQWNDSPGMKQESSTLEEDDMVPGSSRFPVANGSGQCSQLGRARRWVRGVRPLTRGRVATASPWS